MLYEYIVKNYKEGEPIFFSDIEIRDISRPAINKQLRILCEKGVIHKYDKGIYYIPKKTKLHSSISLNADLVIKYRYICNENDVYGYYSGNTFANQIGITTQVPQIIEIVSNNSNSSPREVEIGNRRFYLRKSSININSKNVYTLQLLDLLKNIENYMDGSYEDAREKIKKYIKLHQIKKKDIDKYIRKFPINVYKNYYELRLDNVFA